MKLQPAQKLQKMAKISFRKMALALILFVFISVSGYGQTVNNIPIKDLKSEYVEIVGTAATLFGNKVIIDIDFGQEVKVFGGGKQFIIKNAAGENMEFNSMIDALNFMSQNGYTFVQAYGFETTNHEYVYHYLLRKSNARDEASEKEVK